MICWLKEHLPIFCTDRGGGEEIRPAPTMYM